MHDPMHQKYRGLTEAEIEFVSKVKSSGEAFHALCTSFGRSRELSLALTKIEEAVMWAVKHGTRGSDDPSGQ